MTSESSAADEVFCAGWRLEGIVESSGLRGILKLPHHSSGGAQRKKRALLHLLSLHSVESSAVVLQGVRRAALQNAGYFGNVLRATDS